MPALTGDQVFQLALVALGIAGTIAGSLSGALLGAIYQARKSAPRLQVKASWGFVVWPGIAGPDVLTVSAANVGPLPMRVTGCGLTISGKKQIAIMRDEIGLSSLPADLGPGQSVEMRLLLAKVHEGIQEEANKTGADVEVISAWARDATGKEWRGPVNVRDLRARPHR